MGAKFKNEYQYNNQGNKKEKKLYDNKMHLLNSWDYKYDDKGNLVETTKYDEANRPTDKNTYQYDAKGNVIEDDEIIVRGEKPTTIKKKLYKYDGRDNRVMEETISDHNYELGMAMVFASAIGGQSYSYPNGQKFETTEKNVNKYDDKGNIVERIEKSLKEFNKWNKRIKTFEYNDKNQLMHKSQQYNGESVFAIAYKYDDFGNLVEVQEKNFTWGYSSSKTYILDEAGNWIKLSEYKSEKGSAPKNHNQFRVIEYYP